LKPNLSPREKNRALSQIYDMSTLSTRFIASGMEIDKSISSWPQLSDDVFLNAATLTHAARRIMLGDDSVVSGRFSVDMSRLFSPHNRISTGNTDMTENLKVQGLATYPRAHYIRDTNMMEKTQELLFINHWARSAPSAGNQQPWNTRLCIESGKNNEPYIEVSYRSETESFQDDWNHKRNELALGCLLENAEIAAAHLGLQIQVDDIDTNTSIPVTTCIRLKSSQEEVENNVDKARLFTAMHLRTAARNSKPVEKIPNDLKQCLLDLGAMLVDDQSSIMFNLRQAIVDERKARLMDMKGLFSEVGEGQYKLHPKVLGLSEDEQEAFQNLSKRPDVINYASAQGFHKAMLDPFQSVIENTKLLIILCNDGENFIEKGRILERAWLEMTNHGIGARPFSLSGKQLKTLGVSNAFFVFSPVEPQDIPYCSSRL